MNPDHEIEKSPREITDNIANIILLTSLSLRKASIKKSIKNKGKVTLNISVSKNPANVCEI